MSIDRIQEYMTHYPEEFAKQLRGVEWDTCIDELGDGFTRSELGILHTAAGWIEKAYAIGVAVGKAQAKPS